MRTRRFPTRRPKSCWAAPWSPRTILACWMRRSPSSLMSWVPINPYGREKTTTGLGGGRLAVAYERKGNTAEALLATARKLFYSGNAKDIREAQIHAKRAQQIFTRGSRGWLISEGIVPY